MWAGIYFLQALAFENRDDSRRAEAAFEDAIAAGGIRAPNWPSFEPGSCRLRIISGEATDALAGELKRQVDEFQGRRLGFSSFSSTRLSWTSWGARMRRSMSCSEMPS